MARREGREKITGRKKGGRNTWRRKNLWVSKENGKR